MCSFFSSSNAGTKAAESKTADLSANLTSEAKQTFGEQQDTIGQINSQINQIKSGTTGPGFGAPEVAAKTTQIQNNAAASVRNAQQAAQNSGAGQVFGGADNSSGLKTAINKQVAGQIASNVETNESNQLADLTKENYAQGRTNALQTEAGLNTLAGIENPQNYNSEALNAVGQVFGEQNTIKQEIPSIAQDISTVENDVWGAL